MIKTKPISYGNLTSNAILEGIKYVLGYIVRTYDIQFTYEDKDYPWMGILAAAVFKFALLKMG